MKQELIFLKCNFRINLQHKLLPVVMGSSINLRKIFAEVEQEKTF